MKYKISASDGKPDHYILHCW